MHTTWHDSHEHNKTIQDEKNNNGVPINKLTVSESIFLHQDPAENSMDVDPTNLLDYEPDEEEEDITERGDGEKKLSTEPSEEEE